MAEAPAIQYVQKSDGTMAEFSEQKLLRSLTRSGATNDAANEVIASIRPGLYPGIPTREIYDRAFDMLKKRMRPAAARYHLKRAILELGPSGFPFEQFVGEIFRHQGCYVQTNQVLPGYCVQHEVDVLAATVNDMHFIECKYHQAGINCDVKVALYVHARFLDISRSSAPEKPRNLTGWLVTNTRFSSDAMRYGNCSGLQLLSWDFPVGKGLRDIIDREQLYPVTCLTTLTHHEKSRLLHLKIVLCSDIKNSPEVLEEAQVPDYKIPRVMEEVQVLCKKQLHTDAA